ncbi:MAG: protein kinase [bacterium]|nr:protein kinase [bacterium]
MSDGFEQDKTRSVPMQASGAIVNHYRIERLLGAGGMGEVYLADDTKLGRKVALKLLPLAFSTQADLKARLLREAQAAAMLNHPNIMTVYEVGESDGRLFIALEHVDGSPLSELLRSTQFSTEEAGQILLQICEGIAEAHDKGVIHRDIKPSNILLSKQGRVKLVDFGLASIASSDRLTVDGARVGTIGYMSPEQIEGATADVRSDIFALGVVAYELLAGKNPFRRDDDAATLYSLLHHQPVPLPELRSDVPVTLSLVVEQMLSKSPTLRYQSVNAVIADLKQGSSSRNAAAAAPVESGQQAPSIAVLPFEDLSSSRDQEYFCDGITEEIISSLSHIDGLRVVSRTSSFQFKGKGQDIRRIGAQLNVGTLLEGSLRKVEGRLRVTAKLISVADGFNLWAGKYDRAAEDIFAVQDEIAQAIVETLKDRLLGKTTSETVKEPARRHSANVEAYHYYLQGRFHWNARDRQSVIKSLEYFRKALDLDPVYALAYVGLSDAYFMLGAYDFLDPKVAVPAARQAALKALELDDSLAEAHTAYAGLLVFFHFDWKRGEAEFLRAIQLNSGYSTTYQWYAEMLTFQARYEEARRNFETAIDLDPLSHIHPTMFGYMFAVMGDLKRSNENYLRAIDLGSQNYNLYSWYALNLLELGRIEAARLHNQRARELAGRSSYPLMVDAFIAGRTGDTASAREVIDKLEAAAMTEYLPPSYIYLLHYYFGDRDRAYSWLERARETRDVELLFILLPTFNEAASDPHAQTLLESFGIRRRPQS